MRLIKTLILTILLAASSIQADNMCTESQEAPADKPDDFDVNEHLRRFDLAGQTLDLPGEAGLGIKMAIMASFFRPGGKYDFKNNPNYGANNQHHQFGNWFYGAAGAQMGFTLQQSINAAAVVQQFQNLNLDNIGTLPQDLYNAAVNGEGDSEGDSELVEGGHDYSSIYDSDPDSDTNSDSCNPEESSTTESSSSSGGGTSGGGTGWNAGMFIGSGCSGMCYSGTPTTITTQDPPVPEGTNEN